MKTITKVTVLVDNNSWILPYAKILCHELTKRDIDVTLVRNQADITEGDICFMLGCSQIVESENLAKSRHNLVVHESDLPSGKGFAPMAWQILEGKSEIPICVLEASGEVDSGAIWLKSTISLTGYELCGEWRVMQGEKTVALCLECVDNYGLIKPQSQTGDTTFYPRRTSKDSELDINKTLADQFDLLRVVSNENYPAFFTLNGKKYRIEIYRDD